MPQNVRKENIGFHRKRIWCVTPPDHRGFHLNIFISKTGIYKIYTQNHKSYLELDQKSNGLINNVSK